MHEIQSNKWNKGKQSLNNNKKIIHFKENRLIAFEPSYVITKIKTNNKTLGLFTDLAFLKLFHFNLLLFTQNTIFHEINFITIIN